MIYLENISPCIPSCVSMDDYNDQECTSTQRFPGCTCKPGTYVDDGKCYPPIACPCLHREKKYVSGSQIPDDCNICTCAYGQWKCTVKECPQSCYIYGLDHLMTFDNLAYSFRSPECQFILSESVIVSSTSNIRPFKITMNTKKVGTSLSQHSRVSSIRIETKMSPNSSFADDNYNIVVNFLPDSKLSVVANDTLIRGSELYMNADAGVQILIKPTEYSIVIQFENQFQVSLDGSSGLVKITLQADYKDKVRGLCGNNNGRLEDEYEAKNKIISSKENFVTSFSACPNLHLPPPPFADACSVNLALTMSSQVQEPCGLLKRKDVLGNSCATAALKINHFENCVIDVCANINAAADPNSVIPGVCDYLVKKAVDCLANNYAVENFPNLELLNSYCGNTFQCDASKGFIYQLCPQHLQTCRNVHLENEYSSFNSLGMTCVPGCACPMDHLLDEYGKCVEQAGCTCIDEKNNKIYSAGDVLERNCSTCQCKNGNWDCKPIYSNLTCQNDMIFYNQILDCNTTCNNLGNCFSPPKLLCGVCLCPSGYIVHPEGHCVKSDSCPCQFLGKYYNSGQSLLSDGQICVCTNKEWKCRDDPNYKAQCLIYGDIYYTGFDKIHKLHPGQSSCAYTVLETEDNIEQTDKCPEIKITASNIPCGQSGVICSKYITAQVGTVKIILTHGVTPTINNQSILLSSGYYYDKSNKITVMDSFLMITITFESGLVLLYDGGTRFSMLVPYCYKNNVDGLCGKFGEEGYKKAEGPDGKNPSFWKVDSKCPEPSNDFNPCRDHPKREAWAIAACSVILKGSAFTECRKTVDFYPFYEECLKASCGCDTGGDCECMCSSIENFALACSQKGLCSRWRSQHLCPVMCPMDRIYKPCGLFGRKSCNNLGIDFNDTNDYQDGCYCPPGSLLNSDGNCVEEERCNCIVGDKVYLPGETFLEDCKTCVCENGNISCSNKNCTCDELTEFKCFDFEKCIPINKTCDGHEDCPDASDEEDCGSNCTVDQFQCHYNKSQCIPKSYECDGIVECDDGSDEREDCFPCKKNYFHCVMGKCIPDNFLCDGNFDCGTNDTSDEDNCFNLTTTFKPTTRFPCNKRDMKNMIFSDIIYIDERGQLQLNMIANDSFEIQYPYRMFMIFDSNINLGLLSFNCSNMKGAKIEMTSLDAGKIVKTFDLDKPYLYYDVPTDSVIKIVIEIIPLDGTSSAILENLKVNVCIFEDISDATTKTTLFTTVTQKSSVSTNPSTYVTTTVADTSLKSSTFYTTATESTTAVTSMGTTVRTTTPPTTSYTTEIATTKTTSGYHCRNHNFLNDTDTSVDDDEFEEMVNGTTVTYQVISVALKKPNYVMSIVFNASTNSFVNVTFRLTNGDNITVVLNASADGKFYWDGNYEVNSIDFVFVKFDSFNINDSAIYTCGEGGGRPCHDIELMSSANGLSLTYDNGALVNVSKEGAIEFTDSNKGLIISPSNSDLKTEDVQMILDPKIIKEISVKVMDIFGETITYSYKLTSEKVVIKIGRKVEEIHLEFVFTDDIQPFSISFFKVWACASVLTTTPTTKRTTITPSPCNHRIDINLVGNSFQTKSDENEDVTFKGETLAVPTKSTANSIFYTHQDGSLSLDGISFTVDPNYVSHVLISYNTMDDGEFVQEIEIDKENMNTEFSHKIKNAVFEFYPVENEQAFIVSNIFFYHCATTKRICNHMYNAFNSSNTVIDEFPDYHLRNDSDYSFNLTSSNNKLSVNFIANFELAAISFYCTNMAYVTITISCVDEGIIKEIVNSTESYVYFLRPTSMVEKIEFEIVSLEDDEDVIMQNSRIDVCEYIEIKDFTKLRSSTAKTSTSQTTSKGTSVSTTVVTSPSTFQTTTVKSTTEGSTHLTSEGTSGSTTVGTSPSTFETSTVGSTTEGSTHLTSEGSSGSTTVGTSPSTFKTTTIESTTEGSTHLTSEGSSGFTTVGTSLSTFETSTVKSSTEGSTHLTSEGTSVSSTEATSPSTFKTTITTEESTPSSHPSEFTSVPTSEVFTTQNRDCLINIDVIENVTCYIEKDHIEGLSQASEQCFNGDTISEGVSIIMPCQICICNNGIMDCESSNYTSTSNCVENYCEDNIPKSRDIRKPCNCSKDEMEYNHTSTCDCSCLTTTSTLTTHIYTSLSSSLVSSTSSLSSTSQPTKSTVITSSSEASSSPFYSSTSATQTTSNMTCPPYPVTTSFQETTTAEFKSYCNLDKFAVHVTSGPPGWDCLPINKTFVGQRCKGACRTNEALSYNIGWFVDDVGVQSRSVVTEDSKCECCKGVDYWVETVTVLCRGDLDFTVELPRYDGCQCQTCGASEPAPEEMQIISK